MPDCDFLLHLTCLALRSLFSLHSVLLLFSSLPEEQLCCRICRFLRQIITQYEPTQASALLGGAWSAPLTFRPSTWKLMLIITNYAYSDCSPMICFPHFLRHIFVILGRYAFSFHFFYHLHDIRWSHLSINTHTDIQKGI